MESILVLASLGLLAGAMNALAGGGSFVTLPALIAIGVPSVSANASSAVALYPGGVASSWTYRRQMPGMGGVSLPWLVAVTLAGGLAGGLLLIHTPVSAFNLMLPWFLLLATLALTFGRWLGVALRGFVRIGPGVVLPVQFALGVYGGYFGGAVGLMMLAFWSLFEERDLKDLSGTRTLLVSAANTMGAIIFVTASVVRWKPTVVLLLGATIGAYAGARLGLVLPRRAVRALTLCCAYAVTATFFLRAIRSVS
jgi:uncharacterized membrane protein YfcA